MTPIPDPQTLLAPALQARWHQQQLTQYSSTAPKPVPNIPPVGDPLLDKPRDVIRFAFQNIWGTSEQGLALPDEIEALGTL